MRRSAAPAAISRRRPPPLTAPTRLLPKTPPLWPFLAIAAVIVAAIGAVAFAFRRDSVDLRVTGRVVGTPTPTAEQPEASSHAREVAPAFIGSGSWAMSSLPECFVERRRITGLTMALRAKFPPESERIEPPAVVRSGNCTVQVRAHDLWISRGTDRLRVPPEARLYRVDGHLTLVAIDGRHAEIRRYGE